MPTITVIARAKILADRRDRFIAAARSCIAETRKEAGCLGYDMHESVSEPNSFVFVEEWRDRATVDAHMRMPHLQAFLAVAQTCLAEPPTIEAITPAAKDRLM